MRLLQTRVHSLCVGRKPFQFPVRFDTADGGGESHRRCTTLERADKSSLNSTRSFSDTSSFGARFTSTARKSGEVERLFLGAPEKGKINPPGEVYNRQIRRLLAFDNRLDDSG